MPNFFSNFNPLWIFFLFQLYFLINPRCPFQLFFFFQENHNKNMKFSDTPFTILHDFFLGFGHTQRENLARLQQTAHHPKNEIHRLPRLKFTLKISHAHRMRSRPPHQVPHLQSGATNHSWGGVTACILLGTPIAHWSRHVSHVAGEKWVGPATCTGRQSQAAIWWTGV